MTNECELEEWDTRKWEEECEIEDREGRKCAGRRM